jgi:peptide/nickel transport system ATP-binding protein
MTDTHAMAAVRDAGAGAVGGKSDSRPLLDVRGLRTEFFGRNGRVRAVDDVSLSVERGAVLGLVGESGCGKSATALSLMMLLPRDVGSVVGGRIEFDGRDLTKLESRELEDIRGRDIAMVFQDPMVSLNPSRTIEVQITETLRRHTDISKHDAKAEAKRLLEEVELPRAGELLRAYPHQLSGGMRQRVMIASAIACKPKLLIADEPTTALDATVQRQILTLLDRLRREHGMAMILITHSMGVVAQVADDVAVMYAGQVVERASVAQIFETPEHPYTEALFAAMPQSATGDLRKARLAAIAGRPPDLADPPSGCRFAPRCPHVDLDPRCREAPVELLEVRPGQFARSHHPRSRRRA